MKLFALALCFLFLTQLVFASAHQHSEESSEEPSVESDEEVHHGHHHHHHHHHHRSRRFLETTKKRRCGQKLLDAVQEACNEQCISGSDVDISTSCCSKKCDYQEIRRACCPDKVV